MATRIGVIKSISQGSSVIATAKDGTQRVLKVGDEIFLGETIQTTDFDSKVVITANDGKDIAIIGKDTLNLDKSVAHNESFGDDSVADVSAIQKALLDGANITDLEETAAGGNQGGNAVAGAGVSLGSASFEQGGHYSNISASTSAINSLGAASFAGPVEGKSDGLDSGRGGDDGFYIDTAPPSVIIEGVTPVDTNKKADGNPDKGIVSGKSDEPNAPVVITDKDGNEIGRGTTDGNGGFTIETKPFNPGDPITATVTDKAGNKGSDTENAGSLTHPNDTTAPCDPTITFVEDINPKDGKLNKAENGSDSDNANTTAKISFLPDVVKGDVIKYTINNGNEQSHTVTADDVKAGYIEVKVPVVDGKTSTIAAKIVDQAGNASKEVSSGVDVDLTIGNPKVRFLEDTDNNGVLSVAEVAAIKDGKAHWVIDIPIDGSVKAGDVIQSIDSKGNWVKFVTITDEMIKDGRFEATFNVDIEKLRNGKYETPEYRFADDAGNVSDSSKATLTLDSEFSRKPSNPEIKFPEDNDPKDGKISDKENKEGDKDAGKTTAEVTIPQDGSVKPGDKVVVTDNNGKKTEKPIEQSDIDKGSIDIPVDLNPGKDNTVIAEIVNPNNPDNPGKGKGVIGENSEATKAPEAPVIVDVKGGKFNEDVKGGLTNDNTPTIKGTAKPGVTITIKDGDKVIDGDIKYNGDGSWEFTPKTPLAEGKHELTAIATSKTGVVSNPSNVAAIDVDTTIRIELTEVVPIAEGSTPGAHISKPIYVANTVSMGHKMPTTNGNDYIRVKHWVSNCAKIDLGNGNDTLSIGGIVENGVAIFAGKGNNKITIGKYLKKSLVDLGEGGANIVKTHLVGESDECNAKFIIKDKNNIQIGEDRTDADGKFDMYIDKVVKPGEKLSVEIVDTAGNKVSDSKVAGNVEVSAASRHYDNELDVGTNIHAATVIGKDGNDLVVVGEKGKPDGYIIVGSKILLGEGDNEVRVQTNIGDSEITTGGGDDIVTTGLRGSGFGYITNETKINLGDGDNKLTVGTNIDSSSIETGKGNDVIKVGGYIHNSKVELGAGDDTLVVGKADLANSKVDGGTGYDKLVLDNPGKSVNLSDISKFASNFEELDISGAKNITLEVSIKDVLDMTDDKNTLKITGDKGDTVDLKENIGAGGWNKGASEDGYTTYINNTVTIQIKDEIHVI